MYVFRNFQHILRWEHKFWQSMWRLLCQSIYKHWSIAFLERKETLNMMFVHTYDARIERQEKRLNEGDVKRLLYGVYMWSRIWSMGLIQLCFLVSFSLWSLFRDRSQEEKHCKAWFICSICAFDRPDKAYWLTNDSAWCKKIAPLQRWSSSKGTASCQWPQVVLHVFFVHWRAFDDAMPIGSFLINNRYLNL